MGIVAFNYETWSARYPELASFVDQPLAAQYFSEAGLYLDNTACSPVRDDSVGGERAKLLNMLTSHIAALNAPLGTPSSPLVGRIASAGQGSVNVSTQMSLPQQAEWYAQTKYGIAYWNATKKYRAFLYVRGPRRRMDPWKPFGRR